MDTTTTTQRRTSVAPRPSELVRSTPIVVDHSASQRTSLIFMALLGMAACLALAGVVTAARDSESGGTSVDDAPPAVFVEAD